MSDLFLKNTIDYNFKNVTADIHTMHKTIIDKLNFFIENNKIPHIVFHGPYGTGKRSILNYFIEKVYHNNPKYMKEYVMYVDCAHGKGIRFFRDQLKFFAKTNIQNKTNNMFKSIILFNADKLTMDAQSALRRCIEKYSHNTRFFIIAENKNLLLNPILSRFCSIYIPTPKVDQNYINFYNLRFDVYNKKDYNKKETRLKKYLKNTESYKSLKSCIGLSSILYNKGYSCLDLIKYVSNNKDNNLALMYFDKIRKQIRNEELLIFYVLYFTFMRKKVDLENIL
jgi:DNA polymerase III delta prime subunit